MAREIIEFWMPEKNLYCCGPCIRSNPQPAYKVKGWLCDNCGEPFQPKKWDERYTICQKCWYAEGGRESVWT